MRFLAPGRVPWDVTTPLLASKSLLPAVSSKATATSSHLTHVAPRPRYRNRASELRDAAVGEDFGPGHEAAVV